MYPSLSERMISWMTYCAEYKEAREKAISSGTYDLDRCLYHEEQRMISAEVIYIDGLRESLGLTKKEITHENK